MGQCVGETSDLRILGFIVHSMPFIFVVNDIVHKSGFYGYFSLKVLVTPVIRICIPSQNKKSIMLIYFSFAICS